MIMLNIVISLQYKGYYLIYWDIKDCSFMSVKCLSNAKEAIYTKYYMKCEK